jgi:DNA-binding CsgD family transcriptional regulator
MNQELEDLMLEYLLRKKLNLQAKPKNNNIQSTPMRTLRRPKKTMHKWTEQDYQKVAFLYRQGMTPSEIAAQMNLRTEQVKGAIGGMRGINRNSAAPRLLVQS